MRESLCLRGDLEGHLLQGQSNLSRDLHRDLSTAVANAGLDARDASEKLKKKKMQRAIEVLR